MLALGATVPAAHTVGALTPTPQECPAGHAVHWVASERPPLPPKLPSAHGAERALTLPASQKKPASHSPEHVLSRSASNAPYRPAAHGTHSSDPSLGAIVPAAHCVAACAPAEEALPAGDVLQLVTAERPV